MKWNQIGKQLTPPFLRRKREEKPMAKGMDHLYTFSMDIENRKLNVTEVRKCILMNPWSIIANMSITFTDNSATISFRVLSTVKGKEIEKLILDTLIYPSPKKKCKKN